jgi:ABC-type multidrug transport system fused ATPase/permease subunit
METTMSVILIVLVVIMWPVAILAIVILPILALSEPAKRGPKPAPKSKPAEPAVQRRWSTERRAAARRELIRWQVDFNRMVKDAELVPPGRGPLS